MTTLRAGQVTAAVALVALGVVILLHAAVGTPLAALKYLWPLVLIGGGVEVMAGGVRPGGGRLGGWSVAILAMVALGSLGLAVLPSVPALHLGERYAEPVHGRLRVAGAIRAVDIDVSNTPVTVTGSSSATVAYDGVLMAEAASQADAARAIRAQWSVRRVGSTLVMALTYPPGEVVALGDWASPLAQTAPHLRVRIPTAFLSQVSTSNGAVRVEHVHGAVDVQTSNAAVDVSGGGASVVVHTSNGSVQLDDVAGAVKVKTSNGEVDGVSRVGGDWSVATSNAPVELRLATATSARISAATTNGAVGGNVPWTYANGGRGHGTATLGTGAHSIGVGTTNGDVTVNVRS